MISNDTAVTFGGTALLTCIGYAIPMVEVSWMLDGRTITNSTAVTITEADVALSGALFKQSVLQICSISPTQSGTYTCAVTNTQIDIDAPIEVSVSGKHSFVSLRNSSLLMLISQVLMWLEYLMSLD